MTVHCAHPVELLTTLLVSETCCTGVYACCQCGQRVRVESWNLTLLTPEKARDTVSQFRARVREDHEAQSRGLPFD